MGAGGGGRRGLGLPRKRRLYRDAPRKPAVWAPSTRLRVSEPSGASGPPWTAPSHRAEPRDCPDVDHFVGARPAALEVKGELRGADFRRSDRSAAPRHA